MAAHIQQQILDAMKAALVAAATAAGARVYVDRPDELTPALLPAIVITAGQERVEALNMGYPVTHQRVMQIDCRAVAMGTGAAYAARTLAGQIESALFASESAAYLGGLIKTPIELIGTDPQIDGQGSQLIAEVRQLWQLTYFTVSGAPDTPV